MTTEKIKVPEVEKLIAPGAVFKRILATLEEQVEDMHLDGSPEWQRGFMEGFRAAMRSVKVTEGNLACEVTALRHRKMREEAKKDEA